MIHKISKNLLKSYEKLRQSIKFNIKRWNLWKSIENEETLKTMKIRWNPWTSMEIHRRVNENNTKSNRINQNHQTMWIHPEIDENGWHRTQTMWNRINSTIETSSQRVWELGGRGRHACIISNRQTTARTNCLWWVWTTARTTLELRQNLAGTRLDSGKNLLRTWSELG